MKEFIFAIMAIFSYNTTNASSADVINFTGTNVCSLIGTVDRNSVQELKLCFADKVVKRGRKTYPLYLYINSGGGDVAAGLDFIEYAENIPNLHTVTKFAASMAAAIVEHLPGKRYITKHGVMMFHRARGSVSGQFEKGELESRLRLWKSIIRKFEQVQADRIGITLKEYKKRRKDEWWVYGSDNISQNTADEIKSLTCSPYLMKQFKEVKERTIFGTFKYKKYECPILN